MSKVRYKFKCVFCGNCCSDKGTIVNLTYLDILRIVRGLNLSEHEILELLGFFVFSSDLSEETLQKMVIPPITTLKGKAFVGLLKNVEGACIFLKDNLCKIYNLRPMFCRSFPFSFKTKDIDPMDKKVEIHMYYTSKALEYCKGISDDAPYINNKKWIKIGNKITKELQENAQFIEIWNMNVEKGRIQPTAKNFIKMIFRYDKK